MILPLLSAALLCAQDVQERGPEVRIEEVLTAGRLAGIEFSEKEAEQMLREVARRLRAYERLRGFALRNGDPPALRFAPAGGLLPGLGRPRPPAGAATRPAKQDLRDLPLPAAERPPDLERLAFAPVPVLAALIKERKLSCLELTRFFLARLKRLDRVLHCVITFTEERALRQAELLDRELARGKWRGPLHGIPWGVKDLCAVRGYRTTWGAKPFERQVIDEDAEIVRRLDEAGAVLIAKLSLGALAWGDVWFGGRTRNPWDPRRGSSGSSAGPASAVAAGGVAFAIGSETLGSIVSPSSVCGCSSLRPTFGRVPRSGAMALSWSMDKLGPMCRSIADAALVFAVIQGPDGRDPECVAAPFRLPPPPASGRDPALGRPFRVGYLAERAGDPAYARVLAELRRIGVRLVPFEIPDWPAREMTLILVCEAAAAFDELTRSGRDDLLVRQVEQAWPNVLRAAHLIPAVEYIRANRLRTLMLRDFVRAMDGLDAVVHPSFSKLLSMTNLTGHPTAVVPAGFTKKGLPYSISFTGRLFGESRLLALVQAWQEATPYHRRHPSLPAAEPRAEPAAGAGGGRRGRRRP